MDTKARNQVPRIPWSKLRDDPTRPDIGWSFVKDERNQWPVDGKQWLFERLTRNGSRYELVKGGGRGGIWNRKAVRRWMRSVVDFREKLLVLIHWTGGQPARGPEVLSIRHANTANGEHRNVFIEDGKVMIVTRYHKGYAISGDVKIIHRYLPRAVGGLLVYYLWLVIPLYRTLHAELSDRDSWSSHLWPRSEEEKQWSPERMTAVLKRESRQLHSEGIGLAAWREIAIAISRRFMRGKQRFSHDDEDDEGDYNEDAIEDLQAGHGSHVAGMIYARGVREMFGEVLQKREMFKKASEEWHRFLGLSMELEETGMKRGRELYEDRADQGPYERWKVVRRLDLREKLKQMMGPESEFRSVQEQALQAVLDATPRVLVIMSTSGGKSLIFMLPAWLRTGGVSVIVVPLIALRQDMLRRSRQLGISCEAYETGKASYGGDLILVTPESALSDGFATLLNRLKGSGRLDRIVIDECHVMLNEQREFRPKLQRLGELNRFGVQLVMLTATLPPSKEVSFLERAWITREQVKIIRSRTSRGNIEYRTLTRKGENVRERKEELIMFLKEQAERVRKNKEGGVMIVYSNGVEAAQETAEELECDVYHHKAEQKKEILSRVIEGEQQVVVATSAFGMGIDVRNIRVVIHIQRPRSLMEYGQESGRAGRDGKISTAWLIDYRARTEERSKVDEMGKITQAEREEDRWVDRLMEGNCTRVVLDMYLDGRMDREGCEDGEERCGKCKVIMGDGELRGKKEEEELVNEWRQKVSMNMEIEVENKAKETEAGELLERGRIKADRMAGRCVWCRRAGLDDEHSLFRCDKEGSKATRELYGKMKGEIRSKRLLDKFGGCYGCLAPYEWCNRWIEGEEEGSLWVLRKDIKRCRLEDVILGEVAERIWRSKEYRGVIGEKILIKEARDIKEDWIEKVCRYLGRRSKIGGLEVMKIVGEFIKEEYE